MPGNDNLSPKENPSTDNPNMSPDGLYYVENGLYVFTEKFHLKRGYCCANGCRHCPYKKA
jgi:hypothetical protein